MLRQHLTGIALALSLVLSAVVLAQTPTPATQEDEAAKIAEEKKNREAQLKAMPVASVASARDVVQFAIEKDDLIVRTSVPPTESSAVVIKGQPTLMSVSTHRGEGAEGQGTAYVPLFFQFMNHEYPPTRGGIAITQVTVVGQRVTVSKTGEGDGQMRNVELLQDDAFLEEGEDRVRFYVQEHRNDEQIVDLKLSAPNVSELRRRYPAETMRYLEPIFRDFGQASVLFLVNARAAWQALGASHQPPADVTKQVDAILVKLDADDPKQREAAVTELEKLGQPAALVLMKRDRKGLSEEQQARIETFIAPYKPLTDEEAAKMRADPEFLLLTLSSDDPALAALALDRLKEIAKQPINFDLNATGQARTDAIAALRAALLPAATQPATTKTFKKSSSDAP